MFYRQFSLNLGSVLSFKLIKICGRDWIASSLMDGQTDKKCPGFQPISPGSLPILRRALFHFYWAEKNWRIMGYGKSSKGEAPRNLFYPYNPGIALLPSQLTYLQHILTQASQQMGMKVALLAAVMWSSTTLKDWFLIFRQL